jgi:hypothetical protein
VSRYWNAMSRRYDQALKRFGSRVVEADDSGAFILTNGEAAWYTPAQVITAAEMMTPAPQDIIRYEVWYARQLGTRPCRHIGDTHECVGVVEAANLEALFAICNHWNKRSMSVGDVAYDGWNYWICEPMGWSKMDQSPAMREKGSGS